MHENQPVAPGLNPSQARIHTIRVVANLPEPLRPLLEVAQNMWWCWNIDAVGLFMRLDRELWEQTHHNPVAMLGQIAQERLDRAASDRSFLHALGQVHARLREHMESAGWFSAHRAMAQAHPGGAPMRVAYFCAEFGLSECLEVYSGGLGCLAGDHLKSAADLGVPLVAVGLLYRRGYFHQYLNQDGWQQESYREVDTANLPIRPAMAAGAGSQLSVEIEFPGRVVTAAVWRCDVGRVPLYLLDTNLPQNARDDREITANLYGGDQDTRIRQEIVLGIGGVRALEALGERPTVVHLNEGHAAFAALERIARCRQGTDLSFDEARQAVSAGHVFTTHTPVPAGIDRFPPAMVLAYLGHMAPRLGLDAEGLLALGRENTADQHEPFSMAVLAIRTSRYCNGVSALHGAVSRGMWKGMWPAAPEVDVPIGHVTNGVHTRSWVSPELAVLFDRYLGDRWHHAPHEERTWSAVDEIPDEELWAAHQTRRRTIIAWARRRHREQLVARGASAAEIEAATGVLEPDILTIGFARRFATYKRGDLFMRDAARLLRVLTDPERPVQLLIAGKSHPADNGGKHLIREIVQFARRPEVRGRVVFIEDYDIQVGRRMVQGCDVWLNNPIRGLEASGTSGMKAAANGSVHCSVLDGWWDEGFDPEVGFAIGRGEHYADARAAERDDSESRSLYQTLESHIVPEFYDRDAGAVPRRWVARMKRCIKALAPRFSTHRMLIDYAQQYYFPAHNAAALLLADGARQARLLAQRIEHLRRQWHNVRVLRVAAAGPGPLNGSAHGVWSVAVRSAVQVTADVALGDLETPHVQVQLVHGRVGAMGDLAATHAVTMRPAEALGQGRHRYTGSFAPPQSGQHGFAVRVLPYDERLASPMIPGLIAWDQGPAEPETDQPAGLHPEHTTAQTAGTHADNHAGAHHGAAGMAGVVKS